MSLSVLQVASGFPNWGGTELHILNLSDQLRRRGHRVTIACRPGRWVDERARALGLPTIPISMERQQDWRDFDRLRAYLREQKPDVLHVHWSLDTIVPGIAARMEGVPVRVLSRHMPYPFKNRMGTLLYSQLLFTRLVTVSHSVRNTLVGCGVSPSRIETIHHGTDVQAFERVTEDRDAVRASLGLADGDVAVGVVGRISPEKGHKFLLEAARLLGDTVPLRVVVVGSGPDEDLMKTTAQEMGLGERVIWAGFREDVNNVINALDIMTLPSVWNEPCSAVVQQAMALSKPVIGTRAGGTPEMIVDGETGLLVPPSDAQSLADAVARLAADPAGRGQMGDAGRARVEAQFSLSVMTDKIEALYYRELAARGAGALHKAVPAS